MIENLVIGDYYKLSFDKNNWPNLHYYVVVSGITNKEAMGNITDYSVKEELFQNYNLGLLTYLQTIDCDLYIVNEITNLETEEVDSETRFLIPHLMIDFDASEKLIRSHKLSFNIDGIRRRFDSEKDINDYISESRYQLKNQLNYLYNFAGDNLSIDGSSSSSLIEESYILKEEKNRSERLLAFQNANKIAKLNSEDILRNALYIQESYEKKLQDLTIKEEKLLIDQENNNSYYNEIIMYSNANDRYSNILRETCRLMKEVASELNVEVPDYETFIQEAMSTISNPTSLELNPENRLTIEKGDFSFIIFRTNAKTIEISPFDNPYIKLEIDYEMNKINIEALEKGEILLNISAHAEDYDPIEKSILIEVIDNEETEENIE